MMKNFSITKCISLIVLFFMVACTDTNESDDTTVIDCNISLESILTSTTEDNEISYIFKASKLNFESDIKYIWHINGIETAEFNDSLNYTFNKNGTYEICVFSETPECPTGIESCLNIIVDSIPEKTEECPSISFETLIENNNYRFEASGHTENTTANYVWSINNEFIIDDDSFDGANNEFFSYQFPNNGNFNVCVFIETPECPLGIMYCEDILVTNNTDTFNITTSDPTQDKSSEGCFDLTYSYQQKENNIYTLSVDNPITNDEVFSWFVNGNYINDGLTIDYEFTKTDSYNICVMQETPNCPLGVSFCREFKVF